VPALSSVKAGSSEPGGIPRTELDRSYVILGLRTDAGITEIRTAYRRLALRYHPDRNEDLEAAKTFVTMNEAYNTIQVASSLLRLKEPS